MAQFQLPDLPYAYDALEPFIDAQTMEIHHSKHHAGYTNNLSTAIEGHGLEGKTIEDILTNLDSLPESIRMAVRNNGGGYYNHSLFWESMKPDSKGVPSEVETAINATFGNVDKFKQDFSAKATGVFGSGWAWLVMNSDGSLEIKRKSFQNNPIMEDASVKVLLGIDVWEHAYYLKYQNRRPEYIENWWKVVNWEKVAERMG